MRGNEIADALVKKGIKIHTNEKFPTPYTLKNKTAELHKKEVFQLSKEKKWENIHEFWELNKKNLIKKAVAKFRLKTRHDWPNTFREQTSINHSSMMGKKIFRSHYTFLDKLNIHFIKMLLSEVRTALICEQTQNN